MNLRCQQSALGELKTLSEYNRQSVIIDGPKGCGKTYLAHQYARMLRISEFHIVQPAVSTIRDTIEDCLILDTPVVLCIENLDTGTLAASYTLLKFFEEPISNIYIVITCRQLNRIPSTIISRGVCVTTSPPIRQDIEMYAANVDNVSYQIRKSSKLLECVSSLSDIDMLLKLSNDQISYIENLKSLLNSSNTVSTIVWDLGHFEDKTPTPIELVIRYLMRCINTAHMRECAIECLDDLTSGRIAAHTVLTRFVFDMKYTE